MCIAVILILAASVHNCYAIWQAGLLSIIVMQQCSRDIITATWISLVDYIRCIRALKIIRLGKGYIFATTQKHILARPYPSARA